MICLLTLIAYMFYALAAHHWRLGLILLLFFLTFIILMFGSFRLGNSLRMSGFRNLAQRSKPLIEAIHKYEADQGRPPKILDNLAPKYLKAIPQTGMDAYPKFDYIFGREKDYDGNPWVLCVHVGYGLGFDEFLYLPRQNYPKKGYGGRLERVEDWAYVHE